MDDQTKDTVKTSSKAVAALGAIPTLLSLVPDCYTKYVLYGCAALASIGLAATQIDIPKDDKSKWRYLYAVLSFLALNWGKALNAAVYLKSRK